MHNKQLLSTGNNRPGLVFLGLFLSLAMSGCASNTQLEKAEQQTTTAQTDTTSSQQVKTKANKVTSPAQELTPELLYDLMLAEIALQRNDYALAFDKYYAAAAQTRDSRLAKKATRVTLFSKDDAQTFKAVKLWSEIQPENIDVQQIYASSLISQNKDEQALIYLQKVINLSDSFEVGFRKTVSILDTIDDQQRVNRLFERLTKHQQDEPIVQLYRAKLAFKFVDYPATEKHLKALLAIKPDYLEALVLNVELLKKQHKESQAIEALQQVLRKLPKNTALRLELARMLVKAKQYKQAKTHIKRLAKNDLAPEVLFAISLLSIEMEQLDSAKQYLERLHKHRLYASEAAYFIAQLEAGRENYAEAEGWFKRVRSGKYTFEAYLGLVMVYSQQKKFDAAFKLLEHSAGVNDQQSTEILQIKAEVYAQAKDYTKAYEIYTQAVKLAPDNHDILYGRAMLAEKFGRIDLLEKDLKKILASNPKDNQALNALGYTLADRTTRYQEARQYIERALAISPNDVATLDSMGWVLYKMGDHSGALKYMKRAYDKEPDPEIAAHYGEILWVSGQTQKAKLIWDKALKTDPEHRVLIGTRTRYIK
ncbi:tetratricopeptide repeat protein [sulfur-oxidizing endosymbiont of Gigantopelta aegis]|uniref:tetratricopeptide repeat protein n=1 Tax=sulfur-oxidizing endosymbiont of Gigantopelta aegis TaxID=2794934 RepID=UPI0018DC0AF7|nr:tetratricopeptide repeat protein [sulfur-oxidizing endosymbiont of Gigantopelta aegis]